MWRFQLFFMCLFEKAKKGRQKRKKKEQEIENPTNFNH